MAEFGNYEALAMVAGGDLSDALYHIVKLTDGDKAVNIATAATDTTMMGVLVNAPAAEGRHASVAYHGRAKVVAGAAVNSAGVFLTANSSGRAVAATAGSGHVVIGRALSTASAAGQMVSVLLMQPFVLA